MLMRTTKRDSFCLPSSTDLDKLVPWVFTQQDIVTEESMDRWPEEEYIFHKLFKTLLDIPKQTRGFCDYLQRMDEKFSSQPDGYWEQQKCLHLLVWDVGVFVHDNPSLDRSLFKFQ
jgi:hypothetical protein